MAEAAVATPDERSIRRDADGAEVINANFTSLVSGLCGAQGLRYDRHGQLYLVTPFREVEGKVAGQIVRVEVADAKVEVVYSPCVEGYDGLPSSVVFDNDNVMWVADMRLGILKILKDGCVEQVAKSDKDGNTMQGCHDCTIDSDGNIWFTAPASHIPPAPPMTLQQISSSEHGSVYCLTKSGEVLRAVTGLRFPNSLMILKGIDEQPDTLLVTEMVTKCLRAYEMKGPGILEGSKVWAVMPGENFGGPAGLVQDDEGNVLVANWGEGTIEIFPPEGGQPQARMRCPFTHPSSLLFHPDSSDLYVTDHIDGALWKTKW